MTIGLLNIDWFKKSKATKEAIINEINKADLDFLIVNENIMSFSFNDTYTPYHSTPIPIDKEFQDLNYGDYLKGEIPVRTSIYSKHLSVEPIKTEDPYTSICHRFIVEENEVVFYGTMIGSNGIKYQKKFGEPELNNFKKDIKSILSAHQNVIIAGDFNTSFNITEQRQLSAIQSRKELLEFTDSLQIVRTTENIQDNIDHIFVSQNLAEYIQVLPSVFLEETILKDIPHKGIKLNLR